MTVGPVNEIELTLTAPAPLFWTGSEQRQHQHRQWDKGTTQNWAAYINPTYSAATYQDGETVTFADRIR